MQGRDKDGISIQVGDMRTWFYNEDLAFISRAHSHKRSQMILEEVI